MRFINTLITRRGPPHMNPGFSLAEKQPEVSTLIAIVAWAVSEVQAEGAKGIPSRNSGMPIVSPRICRNQQIEINITIEINRFRIWSRNFPYVKTNRCSTYSASSTSPTPPAAASLRHKACCLQRWNITRKQATPTRISQAKKYHIYIYIYCI